MKDVKQGVFSFSWVVAASHKIHRSLVIALTFQNLWAYCKRTVD